MNKLISLTKILESFGLNKKSAELIFLKKIAQENSWLREQFDESVEVTPEEQEAWQNDVISRWETRKRRGYGEYEDNDLGYETFDIEVGDDIWTINIRIDELGDGRDKIKVKDVSNSSAMAFNKRINKEKEDYKK